MSNESIAATSATGSRKPLIRQGWLRVLLFCIFYFILVTLSILPVSAIIKKMEGSTDNLAELLSGQFLWLSILVALAVALIAVFIFRKFIDRKSFVSLGFRTSGFLPDALSGFLLAVVILGAGSLILYFSGHLKWTDITFNGNTLFIELGLMGIVAFYEELLFRGYILGNLMESLNKWLALLISAILFTLFHIDNPAIGFIPLVNIFLAGALMGMNYIYTGNLWFAIFFHFGWNFFEGPLLGYKLSGISLQPLLQTELNGDLMLTGGDFGFEGSIFDLALTVIAILLLYWIYEKKYQPARGIMS